jgi:hypothetical protein
MKIAPSTGQLPAREKVTTNLELLRQYWAGRRRPVRWDWLFADLEEYDALLRKHRATRLAESKVFEIGYGARPFRLLALTSLGIDASGVDAEVPLLDGSLREFLRIYRTNGFERLAKSLVRHVLFDHRERSSFEDELQGRGLSVTVEKSRFLVSDAAQLDLPGEALDLIISEDVFEHIRRDALEVLVPKMVDWLKPDGFALVRPNIFTGITGGHLVEWSHVSLLHPPRRRKSEPWEHLRKRRFNPNTTLNRMSRSEYRALFSTSFKIVEEIVKLPDLGCEYLTAEVADELGAYDDEELFSNQVLFVLKPRG